MKSCDNCELRFHCQWYRSNVTITPKEICPLYKEKTFDFKLPKEK